MNNTTKLTTFQIVLCNASGFEKNLHFSWQGVTITGRDRTGPPRAAPGELRCICAVL